MIIIIRGPLGVGKTTISKQLAKELGGDYISIDEVLAENGLDMSDGRSIPLGNFLKVNEIIAPRINQNKPVIVDGNFYFLEQIEDLIKRAEGELKIFYLQASIEECIKRDAHRVPPHGEESARAVFNLVSEVDYGIPINTEGESVESINNLIISKLN